MNPACLLALEEAVLPSRVPWHVLPHCDDYLLTVKGESPEERLKNGQRAARVAEEAIDFLGLERHPTKGQWLEQGEEAGGRGQCQLGRVRRHRPPRVSPATAASPYNSAGHGHVSTDSGGPR